MKAFNDVIEPKTAIAPVSVGDNTVQNSAIIDTQGFSGLEFVLPIGAIASGTASFAVTLTEGDDSALADGAAVDATRIDGALPTFAQAQQNAVQRVGITELIKRYVRLTITPTGNAAAALLSAVAILHAPRKAPTA